LTGQHKGKTEQRQKYETGLTVGVNPSIEMSVKGFLDKYFHLGSSTKVEPERPSMPTIQVLPTPATKPLTFEPSKTVFHIFTDGACSENGKRGARGGYAVYFYSLQNRSLDISQPLLPNETQTNNRAELRAIQAALDRIDTHGSEWLQMYSNICIWSDSEYSINCLTKWAVGWKRNGWKKRDGGLIQNLDLIKGIHERLTRMARVSLHHVRAHQDGRKNEFPYCGNVEADRLARASLQDS
jgi:ribonuclease HI